MNHRWKHGSWKIVCINYESLDSISSSSNEGSMVQFILLCIIRNKTNDQIHSKLRTVVTVEVTYQAGMKEHENMFSGTSMFCSCSRTRTRTGTEKKFGLGNRNRTGTEKKFECKNKNRTRTRISVRIPS